MIPDPKKYDVNKIILVLDNEDKKTLGQLIKIIKGKIELNNDVEEILNNALSARNNIIHHVLVDNVELFIQEETRNVLIKKIRKFRQLVQKGISILNPYIEELSKNLGKIELKEIDTWVKFNFN